MKMAPFAYRCPDSLSEAIEALCEPGAKALAGGQSLLPLMAFRLVRPALLVDITRIDGLDSIELGGSSASIGATATHRSVELHPRLGLALPLLRAGLERVGHVAIRNWGTVGGSLAHADPAAEWPALALALDGEVIVTGPGGQRIVAAEAFFKDWMETDLRPGEMVTMLKVRVPGEGAGWGFEELARREGDFALAGAAVVLETEGDRISSARVAMLGVSLMPVRAHNVEAALLEGPADVARVRDASHHVNDDIAPIDDQHAPAWYKSRVARIMLERALLQALSRSAK
jgi:carbon-monoxide dehydrogenase medium subunit